MLIKMKIMLIIFNMAVTRDSINAIYTELRQTINI